jgi:hypothetical protein
VDGAIRVIRSPTPKKAAAFSAALGQDYPYPLQRIEGRRVKLLFNRPRDQNYRSIEVIG